jgi:hypothetical protein
MNSNYRFTTLAGSTPQPDAPIMVLNANDPVFQKYMTSFNKGLLNPNQAELAIAGRSYFTIKSAYGEEPTQIYASRSCTGDSSGGSDLGYSPPGSGFVGYPATTKSHGIDNNSVNNFFSSTNPRIIKSSTSIIKQPSLVGNSSPAPLQTQSTLSDQQMKSNRLGSGKYIKRGQGLTSPGGSKIYISDVGQLCTYSVQDNKTLCFFPASGSGRSVMEVGYIIMHKNGEFQMTDINGNNIPLVFKSTSRPLSTPIPGSFVRFQDDTSFNVYAPNGGFLYSAF